MEEKFNVNNPTKENIDYAFKNLIFYVTASSLLDLYKKQKDDFKKVLLEINEILESYINNENLSSINDEKLQNIKFELIDLDVETKAIKSYFAEWSLLWLDAIISLRASEIKMGSLKMKGRDKYGNISNLFVRLIGYINLILKFETFKEDYNEYKEILNHINNYAVLYEKTRSLKFINNDELVKVYEKADELQTKYICNDKMKSESEFSDYVLNLLCDLRVKYKEEMEEDKENGK